VGHKLLIGMGYFLSVVLWTISSIAVGGVATLAAWAIAASQKRNTGGWNLPKGLLPLSCAFACSLLVCLIPMMPEVLLDAYKGITFGTLLVIGFVLVITSVILSRGDTVPGSRAVRIGSRVLLAINILGITFIYLTIPELR